MTVNKQDLLKKISKIEDEEVLNKIAILVGQATNAISELEVLAFQNIPDDLDIEALKKEQNYNSENLYTFMKGWDYSMWEDIDVREAIKAID